MMEPLILTPLQFFAAAAAICFLGGITSALGMNATTSQQRFFLILYVSSRTTVLGASLAMLGYHYAAYSPTLCWAVIGGCGLLSLGGLGSIDFVTAQFRRWIEQWKQKREP